MQDPWIGVAYLGASRSQLVDQITARLQDTTSIKTLALNNTYRNKQPDTQKLYNVRSSQDMMAR